MRNKKYQIVYYVVQKYYFYVLIIVLAAIVTSGYIMYKRLVVKNWLTKADAKELPLQTRIMDYFEEARPWQEPRLKIELPELPL